MAQTAQKQRTRPQRKGAVPSPLTLAAFALLFLAAACINAVHAAPQLASSADADGNTVVYSVGLDDAGIPSTTTIETIEAAAAATATPTQAAVDARPTVPSADLGQVNSSPTSSQAPPTTFLVYYTVNGVQTSSYSTFSATTPVTPPPIQPSSGSVLNINDYIPPTSSTSGDSTGAAVPARKLSSKNGQIAAAGVLLSMLVGAIAVL